MITVRKVIRRIPVVDRCIRTAVQRGIQERADFVAHSVMALVRLVVLLFFPNNLGGWIETPLAYI